MDTTVGHTLRVRSAEKGTLHCRILQNLFFIRSLLSRTGEIADFPNIQKQT